MPWSTSDRRQRLPRDWPKRVAAVKARARGRCQAETHHLDCDGVGTQVDHRRHGDDHSLANLQLLSRPCHTAKTQTEAKAGAEAMRAKAKHPNEKHPGLT